MNVGRLFAAIVHRDLLVAFRRWGDVASPLMFFAIVSALFPLALSPAPATLRAIGPAVLWVAALLSNLLALNGLYRADIEDGTMEQLLLRPEPLALVMLARTTSHWLATGLPLAVEGREVLDLDPPDRLHAQLGVLEDLDLADVLLREQRGGAADRSPGRIRRASCTPP